MWIKQLHYPLEPYYYNTIFSQYNTTHLIRPALHLSTCPPFPAGLCYAQKGDPPQHLFYIYCPILLRPNRPNRHPPGGPHAQPACALQRAQLAAGGLTIRLLCVRRAKDGGQYLPLSYLKPAGVNYPQNPAFGLHTYIGTSSPFGNEAINVLPSLVGATLVGADKRSQFGRNWLLMSQDFFNKNNGENIYLNNAGASSGGGDWWYDLMPNVFFYQLNHLYPNSGVEADHQFTTIADRFLDAVVRAMGGSDAPWEPAYMNYRAWKFKTMQPNPNGVPEPEAAGAYAWVLYNAWKETGNPDYLKGAEWSIEFLNEWTSNPSYELQLPYGSVYGGENERRTRHDLRYRNGQKLVVQPGPTAGLGHHCRHLGRLRRVGSGGRSQRCRQRLCLPTQRGATGRGPLRPWCATTNVLPAPSANGCSISRTPHACSIPAFCPPTCRTLPSGRRPTTRNR